MKTNKVSIIITGILFFTFHVNFVNAQQINVQTTETFTCSSEPECKRKCEALGKKYIWKKDKTGTTFGTCTKLGSSIVDDNNNKPEMPTDGVFVGTDVDNNSYEKLLSKFVVELLDHNKWTKDVTETNDVPLTIGECEALGGTVQYHPGCSTTLLKCSNRGYAACITKTPLTKK
ncbi:MAG: hypothetical protein HKN51_02700 [Saprospiraceae bacterium]|nr:hypothetical protein [Saprospiraceae bacterium]